MKIDDNIAETFDWTFWFYWIMGTTLGWLVGRFVNSIFPLVISGVAIAAFQWVVLYKRINKAWRWMIFSSLGWIIGYILFVIFISDKLGVFTGVVMGGLLGFFQWLILRNEFSWASWWIVFSILAWTTGLVFMPGLLTSGALPGAITGLVLVILSKYSAK